MLFAKKIDRHIIIAEEMDLGEQPRLPKFGWWHNNKEMAVFLGVFVSLVTSTSSGTYCVRREGLILSEVVPTIWLKL